MSNWKYLLLVLVLFLVFSAGCAGKGSVMKFGLAVWSNKLGGDMQSDNSSSTGDVIDFSKDDFIDFDLTESTTRYEITLGTLARFRMGFWQTGFSGLKDNCGEFSIFGETFSSENITAEMKFTGAEIGGEFTILPLGDIIPNCDVRGYVGFGVKYLGLEAVIVGENSSIDKSVPSIAPFFTVGVEADICEYFNAGVRMDVTSLNVSAFDIDLDINATELKIYAGAWYSLTPGEGSGAKAGCEIGYFTNDMSMDVGFTDDDEKFGGKLKFGGPYFQAIFMF